VHDVATASDEQAFNLLSADSFDPRTSALVSVANESLVMSGGIGDQADVQIIESLPSRLTLDVSAGADGLLVVSQPVYPGWMATVDGVQVPIHRVDYMLQGIAIQSGEHRVNFTYHLTPWPAIVSLSVLLGCVIILIVGLRATRSANR
jgi:uncharacterized membrane protein YfhO